MKIVIPLFFLLYAPWTLSLPENNFPIIEEIDDLPPLLVKTSLVYPRRASKLGLRGQCQLTFDINSDTGKTQNIEVTNCSFEGVFREPCLRSVKKMWFRPPSSLEKPVTKEGILVTCKF